MKRKLLCYMPIFEQDAFVEDFGDWIKDSKLPLEERTIHPRKVDENG